MLGGLIFGKTKDYNLGETVETREIVPTERIQVADDLKEYYLELDDDDRYSDTLELYSAHQEVHVYADGELIYSIEDPESIFGHTTGARYSFIKLPAKVDEVKIVVKALYMEDANREIEIRLGDGVSMYQRYIRNTIPTTVVSFLCIFVGMILIAYWVVVRRREEISRSPVFF